MIKGDSEYEGILDRLMDENRREHECDESCFEMQETEDE